MFSISSSDREDFSAQVLKQTIWFELALAKAQQSGLDVGEVASIRGAILKSLEELKTLSEVFR
jgi:hypothetical protein